MADKKVFLLDRQHYRKELVENLTEKDLEEWVAEEDYNENYTIIKIDGNGYDTPQDAIEGELFSYDMDDYYIFSFGFSETDEELTCFEVETTYKSGRKRSEVIISKDEDSLWKYYDKHHNKNLVADSAIVDSWIQ